MSEDISSKLQQLKDMLNNENLSDNLQSMMGMFADNPQANPHTNSIVPSFGDVDKDMLMSKFKKILDKSRHMSDPRINLLNAIKPYVNPKRQQKIDSCSKILNMTILSKILNEDD